MLIRQICENIDPAHINTLGGELYDRFNSNDDVLAIAVVDEQNRPIGLIERNQFLVKFGRRYGHSLYSGRPIGTMLEQRPIVVEADTAATDFMGSALADRASQLLHGFVVTENGRYLGVGTPLGLMRSAHASNLAHLGALEQALRAKTDLLAVMSHEIRTPLNGVLTIADILQRKLDGTPMAPLVGAIVQSGDMLLRLLNDALDISRAEAGKLSLEPGKVHLTAIAADLEHLWAPRAAEAGLAIRVEATGDDAWMLADGMRLKQVLNNFVSNALKFTPRGEVRVRLHAERRDGRVAIHAEVHDTGTGIDAEALASLFQPFAQTEAGRAKGGAGLGLAVCKQVIEAMGGAIFALSTPGLGSTFGFDVAVPESAAPAAAASTVETFTPPPSALRILVADDNATNRFVAKTLLATIDAQVSSAVNGREAVDLMAAGPFDVVLMDIKMPVMDGLEALHLIRTCGRPYAATPIIALTANAGRDDVAVYSAAGFDAVVGKPFKPEALLRAIDEVLTAAGALETVQAAVGF